MTLVRGSGQPVTVVAHGLGATPAETRALVAGTPGTRVLPQARGHGGVPVGTGAAGLSYAVLAADLLAVADAHEATQAFGVSLGAATLLALLARHPTRFGRIVLLLPAALDRPRTDPAVDRFRDLAAALSTKDEAAVLAHVRAEVPADLLGLPGVGQALAARAAYLLASPGLPALVRALAPSVPLADRSVLGAVTADVLVIGQEGDGLHPAQVARDVAAALPRARLVVADRSGFAVRERSRLRSLVREHLTPVT